MNRVKQLQHALKTDETAGFTIVELAVVIVVIAILAALTIVGYNGITIRANEASAQLDARQVAQTLTTRKDTDGFFPANCVDTDIQVSAENTLDCNIAADGNNFCVQISNGSISYYATNEDASPVSGTCSGIIGIAPGGDVTDVDAAINHTCAIAGGRAYCWGNGASGELGTGSTLTRVTPTAVDTSGVLSGKTMKSISTGWSNTCAVSTDNNIYCWGYGPNGLLGNNGTASSSIPVAVDMTAFGGREIDDVQVATWDVCALAEGDVFCWGQNSNFGIASPPSQSLVPIKVSDSGDMAGKVVTQIAMDGYWGPNCWLTTENQMYCFGYNGTGGVGNGTTTSPVWTPQAVDQTGVLAGKTITDMSTYEYATCAVASGEAFCWGGNGNGQIGDGTTVDKLYPTATDTSGVLNGKTVTRIVSGDYHTCAIADEELYCWGDNAWGQLGNNSTTDVYSPIKINTPGNLANITVDDIATGYGHLCAIGQGLLYCWGSNSIGQIGNGSAADAREPVLISMPSS